MRERRTSIRSSTELHESDTHPTITDRRTTIFTILTIWRSLRTCIHISDCFTTIRTALVDFQHLRSEETTFKQAAFWPWPVLKYLALMLLPTLLQAARTAVVSHPRPRLPAGSTAPSFDADKQREIGFDGAHSVILWISLAVSAMETPITSMYEVPACP